jgi:hypothetical protein
MPPPNRVLLACASCAALCACLPLPAVVRADEPGFQEFLTPPFVPPEPRCDARIGDRVRMKTGSPYSAWIDGRLIARNEATTLLADGPDTMRVENDAIVRLQVSEGYRSNAGRGAAIGGVLGLLAGLAVSGALASDSFFDNSFSDAAAGTLGLGLAGTVAGFIVGLPIRTEHWSEARAPAPVSRPGIAGATARRAVSLSF